MKITLTTLLLPIVIPITIGMACISTLSCCKKKPIDKLPPATQEGKNTMGCLVDGEAVFTEGRYKEQLLGCSNGIDVYGGSNYLYIDLRKCAMPTVTLHLAKASIKQGQVLLNKTPIINTDNYGYLDMNIGSETFRTNDTVVGKVNFTTVTDKILAGTFEFECINITNKTTRKKVTDGRFDIAL
jgi:hypothetical protein